MPSAGSMKSSNGSKYSPTHTSRSNSTLNSPSAASKTSHHANGAATTAPQYNLPPPPPPPQSTYMPLPMNAVNMYDSNAMMQQQLLQQQQQQMQAQQLLLSAAQPNTSYLQQQQQQQQAAYIQQQNYIQQQYQTYLQQMAVQQQQQNSYAGAYGGSTPHTPSGLQQQSFFYNPPVPAVTAPTYTSTQPHQHDTYASHQPLGPSSSRKTSSASSLNGSHLHQQTSPSVPSMNTAAPSQLAAITHQQHPQNQYNAAAQQYNQQLLAQQNAMLSLSSIQSLNVAQLQPQQQQLLQHQHNSFVKAQQQNSAYFQSHQPPVLTPELQQQIKRLEIQANNYKLRGNGSKYVEAIQLYEQILSVDRNNIDVINSKGQCHRYLKDNVSAMDCFTRVLTLEPTNWVAHNNLGMIYKDSDLFEKSIEHYKLAISYGPTLPSNQAYENMAVVLTDLGTRLKLAGDTDKAVVSYNEALSFDSRYCPAYFNLGVVYSERGQMDKALKQYQLAIDYNPHYVEALCNIGVIYKNASQLTVAIEYYERALHCNPNFMIAANNLAIALTDEGTAVKHAGKLDEGIAYYKRALTMNSKYPASWYNLGVAYAEKGRHDDAKICYEMALLFDNKCAEAYNNLGVIYKDRGNLDQAIYYYLEALRANPKFSQTLNNLGVIYTMLGKLDEAYNYCIAAIRANLNYAEAHNNLGVLYRDEGRIDEAIASYQECLRIDPSSRNAGQNRLLAMNSLSRTNMADTALCNELVFQAHQQWGYQFMSLYEDDRYRYWNNSLQSANERVLRIGYVSADFFTHSVSYFIEAPLKFADKTKTHIVCYSNVARKDKKTQHLQSLAHSWRNIHDMNTNEVCELIRSDEIDILVELTGHTAGNRLDVMAMKPAPVQCTWIGYPNTTGLPTIDYRFTDKIVDPVTTKQKFVERLIYLSDGPFLCYTPPVDAPEVSITPAVQRGYVTFGSFNNLAKVNDTVVSCWCRCLRNVPYSRMLIKCKPFASQTVCNKMLQRFNERGITSDRIDLINLLPTTMEHLDTYSQIDISLDTFPYAGTTTTCEALYMGVPVITLKLPFSIHAHNVGATLLSRIETVQQCIAHSEDEYVSVAVALATDINRLQLVRSTLRPNMLASTLCDGKQFTVGLEQTYAQLWDRYVEYAKANPAVHTAIDSSADVSTHSTPLHETAALKIEHGNGSGAADRSRMYAGHSVIGLM